MSFNQKCTDIFIESQTSVNEGQYFFRLPERAKHIEVIETNFL